MDETTGATIVLRQGDVEKFAHDQRLSGIGLSLFDMMGIAEGPLRTATEPIDLHGMTIPAGSMVFLCIASACRDEIARREPNRFDPDRFTGPDAGRLLNFGAGPHYCLGTALAKIAVEESLRAVLAADPPLRLTEDPMEIPWRQVLGRSPARLLVSPN